MVPMPSITIFPASTGAIPPIIIAVTAPQRPANSMCFLINRITRITATGIK